jgi:hypothetical protein
VKVGDWREERRRTGLVQHQKHPLRAVSAQEEQEVRRLVKASSERLDVVRRATALLAVGGGQSFPEAAHQAGLKSGDGVGTLVKRFTEHGRAALSIAAGAGCKPTSTSEHQARISAQVQQPPDRREDGTATWSLTTLQQALRKTDLPTIARETIRQVRIEAGDSFQRTRTWCRTGDALRTRKSGTVTTDDEHTPEKKDGSSTPTSRPKRQGSCS